jgi:hypothetical protein
MENKVLNWEGMSNSSIKKELEGIVHRQISIREKMVQLSEKLEELEKEYFYGNKVLVKRYKGEE